jgi:hypothetical protein
METAEQPSRPTKPFEQMKSAISASARMHWRRWVLALLSVAMFGIATLILPFAVGRHGTASFDFDTRQDAGTEAPNVYARYEQFNVDVNSYLRFTRYFPQSLYDDPLDAVSYRYRPLYPAVSSIIPHVVTLIARWPDWRSALTEPTALRLTFLSMLFTNFVLLVISVQVFYTWLQRHFSAAVSFTAALMFVLSPKWFIAINTVSTRIVGFAAIVIILNLFDKWLLGDEQPTWKQILGVSLAAGTLMLGKTQYDIMFACWLWAIYRRRWRVLGGSFVLFLVPMFVWMGILRLMGLSYYNHDVTVYRQGVWALDMITGGNLGGIYPYAAEQASSMLGGLFGAFSLTVLLMAAWGCIVERDALPASQRHLAALGFLAVLGFSVIVGHPAGGQKFTFDAFFVIYPLAAVGLVAAARRLSGWALKRSPRATWVFNVFIALFFLVDTPIAWGYHSVSKAFVWAPAFNELPALLSKFARLLARTGPEY